MLGGADFTITANGSGFLSNSTVYWGTSALTTVFVSSTETNCDSYGCRHCHSRSYSDYSADSSPRRRNVRRVAIRSGFSTTAAATAPTVPNAVVSVTAGSTATYSISFPASVTNATATCLNLPTGCNMQFFVCLRRVDDFNFVLNSGWNLSGYGGVR